jgi:hypothetical protein
MKKQKLSEADLNNLLAKMRMWPNEYLDKIALLVWDRNYWRHKAELLEKRKDVLEQPDMFEKPSRPEPIPLHGERESIPLGKKAYVLIQSGGVGSIGMFCKIHKITKERALELANEWARDNDKEEMIC